MTKRVGPRHGMTAKTSSKALGGLQEKLHQEWQRNNATGTLTTTPQQKPGASRSKVSSFANNFLTALKKQLITIGRQQRWSQQESNAARDYAEALVLHDGGIPTSIQHLPAQQRAVQEAFTRLCRAKRVRPYSLPGQQCEWYPATSPRR